MNKCERCGGETLFDFYCSVCGKEHWVDNCEMCKQDNDGHLFESKSDASDKKHTCGCGCDTFVKQPQSYCTHCSHQVDKGN